MFNHIVNNTFLKGLVKLVLFLILPFLFFPQITHAGTVDLPKTGQTTCYDALGNVMACAGTGQDGDNLAGVTWPSPRFTDNLDGTITDELTGLIWLKDANCANAGRIWSTALTDVAQLNTDGTMNSNSCGDTSNGGNNQTDWRLPNINELESLINAEESNPTTWFTSQGFTNVQANYGYWSGTTSSQINTERAWGVKVNSGLVNDIRKSSSLEVWPVRSGGSSGYSDIWETGQTTSYDTGDDGNLRKGVSWYSPRFTDNGDGTVADNLTGLVWLKDANCINTNYSGFDTDGTAGDGMVTWQNSLDFITGINDGTYTNCGGSYTDWRLPNRKELHSLTDYSQSNRALPSGHPFTYVSSNYIYWSGSTFDESKDNAWYVSMYYGKVYTNVKSVNYRVWPVRAGGSYGNLEIFSFSPVLAANGATVTITGTNFTGATSVTFGGTEAVSFTVLSDTQISAVVASGSFSGLVSVTTGGTDSKAGFVFDATNPTGSITSPADESKETPIPTFTASASDANGVASVKFQYKTSSAGSYSDISTGTSAPYEANWGAITLTIGTTYNLRIIVTDNAGNLFTSPPVNVTVDTVVPTASITSPANGAILKENFSIYGTASDIDTGVSQVEVQITDGTDYVSSSLQGFTTMVTWVTATGTISWSLDTTLVNWTSGATYTINARATDAAGNVSSMDTSTFIFFPGDQVFTTLSLDLSSQTILQNGTIDITGKLTRLPYNEDDLSGNTITLTITPPDGIATTPTTTTYTTLGHYKFDALSGFTQKGTYTLQASFEETLLLAASSSEAKTVLVGSSAGYAIIVQGKIVGDEGLDSHNKTANRMYDTLIDRGFDDDNIYYFNYDTSQTGVDALPDKSEIQNAISGNNTGAYSWNLKNKLNGSSASLYVIMVDHGNVDTFYINNETITPTELASWLDTLESGLTGTALAEKRIIIYGACYSGSFIPALSTSGRVIISSAAADEESYKGPLEPDLIRSGEYFLEEFFKELGNGYSFKKSFEEATEKTETFTRKGGSSANTANIYLDSAVQHPLLDDNGDGTGSNVLSEGYGDGEIAKDLYLGTGVTYDTNSASNPVEITDVTETVYLDSSTSSKLMWATVNDNSQVNSAVWMEIRPPSKTLSASSGTGQLSTDYTKEFMPLNELTCKVPYINSCWENTYGFFTESGMYEIFYFASDIDTKELTSAKRSVVYKNNAGNNAPTAFGLVSPGDGSEQKTVLMLDWESSSDPDGDAITYNLVIGADSNFSSIVYKEEEITVSMTYVDDSAALSDLTTYYWKVEAVDDYGSITTSSDIWSFSTNNTNAIPGFIVGVVYSNADYSGIAGASLSTDLGGAAISIGGGAYIMNVLAGTGAITSAYAGYSDALVSGVSVSSGGTTIVNIPMSPLAISTPTVDFSSSIYTGERNSGDITITVNLSIESADEITVNYATSDGTATKDTDYFESIGTLTFSPGDTSKTFTVTPKNGGVSDGTVTLTLSNPSNAILGTNNPATLITNFIPTLSEWGVLIFTILILISGLVMLRKRGLWSYHIFPYLHFPFSSFLSASVFQSIIPHIRFFT